MVRKLFYLILLVILVTSVGCTNISDKMKSNAVELMEFKQCAGKLEYVEGTPDMCLFSAQKSYQNIYPSLKDDQVTCEFSSEVYEEIAEEGSIGAGRMQYCRDCECKILD